MGAEEPNAEAVREAVAAHVGRAITSVKPFEEGMSAVYHVSLETGTDVVVKVGTAFEASELLSGPALIDLVTEYTDLPVPEVIAVVPEGDEHIDHAYFLMEYVEGRREPDVNEFSPRQHERLVREAGAHLAAFHELPYEGQFGRLHASDGELFVPRGHDTWRDYVRVEVEHAVSALGERFSDLRGPFEDAMAAFEPDEDSIDTSILYQDYHPKNLVFEPDERDGRVVRAILDFNFRPVGDAPADLAIAERNLVDLPAGTTERAEPLRRAFRDSYVEHRGGSSADHFDSRYPYYRLLAIPATLKHVDYFGKFGWEDDVDRTVRRLRAIVRERCAEIEAQS